MWIIGPLNTGIKMYDFTSYFLLNIVQLRNVARLSSFHANKERARVCRLWEMSCGVANNFSLTRMGSRFWTLSRQKKSEELPYQWLLVWRVTRYKLFSSKLYLFFSSFFFQLELTILAMREIQTITFTAAHVTQAILIHTETCSSSSCPVKQRKSRYTEIYTGLTRPDIWQGTRPKCEKNWLVA